MWQTDTWTNTTTVTLLYPYATHSTETTKQNVRESQQLLQKNTETFSILINP